MLNPSLPDGFYHLNLAQRDEWEMTKIMISLRFSEFEQEYENIVNHGEHRKRYLRGASEQWPERGTQWEVPDAWKEDDYNGIWHTGLFECSYDTKGPADVQFTASRQAMLQRCLPGRLAELKVTQVKALAEP